MRSRGPQPCCTRPQQATQTATTAKTAATHSEDARPTQANATNPDVRRVTATTPLADATWSFLAAHMKAQFTAGGFNQATFTFTAGQGGTWEGKSVVINGIGSVTVREPVLAPNGPPATNQDVVPSA